MRFPHVIDTNTKEAYAPSQAALDLLREVNRKVFPENLEWGNNDCPSLVTFCVRAISSNFKDKPFLDELPSCAERDLLLEILPTDLPLALVVPIINDEIYWQRKYANEFGMVTQRLHKRWTWKYLYIEKYMQDTIEQAQPQYGDENNMEEITKLCCPYVNRLLLTQLQPWKPPLNWEKDEIPEVYPIEHINFEPILKQLYGIEHLEIIYGVESVGEAFNWNMFKFSVLDIQRLTKALSYLNNLRILKLHRSKLEDPHVQTLMQGLIHNRTLIELDLSHCHIGNHGALCIAKVMTVHPTLETLKLCNNKIRALGGQGIGFALLHETCCPLNHLDLRLNPLEHDGTMGILRALVRGDKPKELSLAGCLFEDDTPIRIGQMLNLNRSLEVLDVSSNWFGEEGGAAVVFGLANNRVIKWFDVRETDIPAEHLKVIKRILKRNRLAQEEVDEGIEEEEEGEDVETENVEDITEDAATGETGEQGGTDQASATEQESTITNT